MSESPEMAKFFHNLTPAQHERLSILLEELGEAAQAIGKILRHGLDSHNPVIDDGSSNRSMLEKEIGDVFAAVSMLTAASDLDRGSIESARRWKIEKIQRCTHHQPRISGPPGAEEALREENARL